MKFLFEPELGCEDLLDSAKVGYVVIDYRVVIFKGFNPVNADTVNKAHTVLDHVAR